MDWSSALYLLDQVEISKFRGSLSLGDRVRFLLATRLFKLNFVRDNWIHKAKESTTLGVFRFAFLHLFIINYNKYLCGVNHF